jgi:hypothetical protein
MPPAQQHNLRPCGRIRRLAHRPAAQSRVLHAVGMGRPRCPLGVRQDRTAPRHHDGPAADDAHLHLHLLGGQRRSRISGIVLRLRTATQPLAASPVNTCPGGGARAHLSGDLLELVCAYADFTAGPGLLCVSVAAATSHRRAHHAHRSPTSCAGESPEIAVSAPGIGFLGQEAGDRPLRTVVGCLYEPRGDDEPGLLEQFGKLVRGL